VFRELAIGGAAYRELGAAVERFQSIVPGHRVDLWHEKGLLSGEIGREFPKKKAGIEEALMEAAEVSGKIAAFLREAPPIPPRGFWEKRRLARAASRFYPVSRGCGLPAGLAGDDLPGRAITAPLEFAAEAEGFAGHPAGGLMLRSVLSRGWQVCASRQAISALLKRRMRELGAILLPGPKPAEIQVAGSRATGLTLEKNSHTYNCANLVVAAPVSSIEGLLPPGVRMKKVGALADSIAPESATLTVNLVVPASTVPEGMGGAVMLCGTGGSGREHAPIALMIAPLYRNRVLQKDETLVSAVMKAPLDGFAKDRAAAVSRLKSALLERMSRPFPFMAEKAAIASTPFDAEHPSDRPDSREGGGVYALQALTRPSKGMVLDLCATPARAGWDNLIPASREAFPGLGLDGQFLCGRVIADLIERTTPRQG
jgi:hypothetical protein